VVEVEEECDNLSGLHSPSFGNFVASQTSFSIAPCVAPQPPQHQNVGVHDPESEFFEVLSAIWTWKRTWTR
jgi:hypothetical protein